MSSRLAFSYRFGIFPKRLCQSYQGSMSGWKRTCGIGSLRKNLKRHFAKCHHPSTTPLTFEQRNGFADPVPILPSQTAVADDDDTINFLLFASADLRQEGLSVRDEAF